MKTLLLLSIFALYVVSSAVPAFAQAGRSTLYVDGRYLYTPCNEVVTLRGINKMIVWTYDLQVRHDSYAEIRKTGANCLRIVWVANPTAQDNDAGPSGLDKNIQDCIDQKMIPIVELHDATGDWNGLQTCVNYWISPDVLSIIKKHEKYLIINIANECGDETVTDDMFKTGYKSAVTQMRNAGIKVPLIIDASDWGKNLAQLRNTGPYLINNDPEHNLIFSVHMYWPISEGADAAYITQEFQAAVDIGLPFIVGEFTYLFNRSKVCEYEADYKTIIKLGQEMGFGWMPWEWGPGNDYYDKSCAIMNMTNDSYFNTLKDTWAKEVAITSPYSISQTSITSKYIQNGGKCDVSDVETEPLAQFDDEFQVYPNPVLSNTNVIINLKERVPVKLTLYNSLGDRIGTIAEGTQEAGRHQYYLQANYFQADGIYYLVLNNSSGVHVQKIIKMEK